eukprot:4035772-Prymnesium_polylepis.1
MRATTGCCCKRRRGLAGMPRAPTSASSAAGCSRVIQWSGDSAWGVALCVTPRSAREALARLMVDGD